MRAVTYIMNDDLEAAEAGLTNGNSSFHKVHSKFPDVLPKLRADGFYPGRTLADENACRNIARERNGSFLKSYAGI